MVLKSSNTRFYYYLDFNVGHLGLLVDAPQDTRHDLSGPALVPVLEALPHDVTKALLELHRIRHLVGKYKTKTRSHVRRYVDVANARKFGDLRFRFMALQTQPASPNFGVRAHLLLEDVLDDSRVGVRRGVNV